MDDKTSPLFLIFHYAVMGIVFTIVALTSYVNRYKDLLHRSTLENGPFEWGTAIVLFVIGVYTLFFLFQNRTHLKRNGFLLILIFGLAILALLGALEEISWGQNALQFKSTDFFIHYNKQKETNIHNLIDPQIFNVIINAPFYALFLFLPLVLHFFINHPAVKRLKKNGYLEFAPPIHIVLMVCFACSLQAFFLPMTYPDTFVLSLCLICFSILIFVREKHRTISHILHLGFTIVSAIFFSMNYTIFRYENMQYEIREFVFVYAFFFWFIQFTSILKKRLGSRLGVTH